MLCPQVFSVQCLPLQWMHISAHLFWPSALATLTNLFALSLSLTQKTFSSFAHACYTENFPWCSQLHGATQRWYCFSSAAVWLQVFHRKRIVCDIYIVFEFHPSLSFDFWNVTWAQMNSQMPLCLTVDFVSIPPALGRSTQPDVVKDKSENKAWLDNWAEFQSGFISVIMENKTSLEGGLYPHFCAGQLWLIHGNSSFHQEWKFTHVKVQWLSDVKLRSVRKFRLA